MANGTSVVGGAAMAVSGALAAAAGATAAVGPVSVVSGATAAATGCCAAMSSDARNAPTTWLDQKWTDEAPALPGV